MKRRIWSVIGMTILLSACATTSPQTGRPDSELPATLARLQANGEQGRTGSVWGFLYLREPGVATPLKDHTVVLLPLTPQLQTVVQQTRQAYREGGYAPLPFQTLSRLKTALDTHLAQLREAGRGDLIRQVHTETGDDPKFEFLEVPEGRWLLLAELPAPPTLAVWVVPVTVTAGAAAKQSLGDQTVIEGMVQ
jgi:hypothetical protein